MDMDEDGVPDCNDGCSEDGKKTESGKCRCGKSKMDLDGDGTPDCNDRCPMDAGKITPGKCGCSMPKFNLDSDGTLDCNHSCSQDAMKTKPSKCGCGTPDEDTDGDEILDCNNFCHKDATNTEPANVDAAILTPIQMVMTWPTVLITSTHWTQIRWSLESTIVELQTLIATEMKHWIAKISARTIPRRLNLVSVDVV